MSDENIWRTIGGKGRFCSHKLHTDTEALCKNKNNVTGICDKFSCPLANSKYATVREVDRTLYLFVKEPERVNTPRNTYEKIELSNDYNEALKQIDEMLEFWDDKLIHKCKQRLTKLTQYLVRLEGIESTGRIEYSVRRKKYVKRERAGALRVLKKIDIEKEVEKELLLRLESGVYGTELRERLNDQENKKDAEEKKETKKRGRKYIAHFEESDSVEDLQPKKGKGKETIKMVDL
jgi:protein MAK16